MSSNKSKQPLEVFTGTIEQDCDYCKRKDNYSYHKVKCKVTREGEKICEYCEEHDINAIRKIKELEIFR